MGRRDVVCVKATVPEHQEGPSVLGSVADRHNLVVLWHGVVFWRVVRQSYCKDRVSTLKGSLETGHLID